MIKYIARLAFKNLFRHKLRTLVSITAIVVSVVVVVFARGFINGLIDSAFIDHIYYNSGHIKIIDREYEKQELLLDLNYPVDGFVGEGIFKMINQLEDLEGIEMAIPRLKFGAMAATQKDLITMVGWGVNPEKEISFTNIEDQIVEGRMVAQGKMEVVMGTGLLEKLNYKVGDKITIVYNTSFNSLKGATFQIVGRIASGLKILDEGIFYLPLDQAQRLLAMDNKSTELLLVTPNRRMVDEVQNKVVQLFVEKGAIDKYLILSYKETGGLIPLLETAKAMYNIIYVFLVALASFVVISTMMMIVKERTKEIGMMSALGLESSTILKLFVIEGTIIGVIGSLVGAILGGIITSILSITGIDYSQAVEGLSSEVMFNSVIYPVFSLENMIFSFILGTIVVTIACIIPARKAARLEPTEALREI